MGVRFSLTMDAADPASLARFWAAALGDRHLGGPDPGEDGTGEWATLDDASGRGPDLFFQRVPEGKVAKNRVHLDVQVGGGRAQEWGPRWARISSMVESLVAAGGTVVQEYEIADRPDHVVMQDPEGNEFCVV